MIGKKVLNQTSVSLPEVKEIIEARKKEGELSYEQNMTLEYVKKFSKLTKKESKTLVDELVQLEKVSEANSVTIADLLPRNTDDLRLIFAREHFVLSEEEAAQILEIVRKYTK